MSHIESWATFAPKEDLGPCKQAEMDMKNVTGPSSTKVMNFGLALVTDD